MRLLFAEIKPSAGFNNIKMDLAILVTVALKSHRALILPKLFLKPGQTIPMEDLFDIKAILDVYGPKGLRILRKKPPGGTLHTLSNLEVVLGRTPSVWVESPFVMKKHVHDGPLYASVISLCVLHPKWKTLFEGVFEKLPPVFDAIHARIEKDWWKHCQRPKRGTAWVSWKDICGQLEKEWVEKEDIAKDIAIIVLCGKPLGKVNIRQWGVKSETKRTLIRRQDLCPSSSRFPYLIQSALEFEIALRSRRFAGNPRSSFSTEVERNKKGKGVFMYLQRKKTSQDGTKTKSRLTLKHYRGGR